MADEEIVQFTLGLTNPFEGTETLQMGTTHIGNQATIGLSSLHQRLDITRMRGTHFHHSNIMAVVKTEQRLGNAYVVVEVALRCHHVITLRQDGTNQFLRSRLTIGTCNANDRNVVLTTMLAGQVLKGL